MVEQTCAGRGQGSISGEVALKLKAAGWGWVRHPGQRNNTKGVWQAGGTVRPVWGSVCTASPGGHGGLNSVP